MALALLAAAFGAPSDPGAMLQDRTGMLWISGSDRLRRSDGVRFAGIDDELRASGGSLRHRGLIGMCERACRIGANLSIPSTPGDGASIEAPLSAALAYR